MLGSFARMEFVQRSKGKNVVAKAAYNSKSRLFFEGNCVLPAVEYDFWSNNAFKPLHHSVLLPKHVSEEFKDINYLWNFAERCEKRKDSQVAKDFVFALSDEKFITDKQRVEFIEKFIEKHFVSKGYGCQLDIHAGGTHEEFDEETGALVKKRVNCHAHVLVTERPFDETGKQFVLKKTKDLCPEVKLAEEEQLKGVDERRKCTFLGIEWGKLLAQDLNEYYEQKGVPLRVEPEGIAPTKHIGPVRMRRASSYEILYENEIKIEEARNKLIKNPELILEHITKFRSLFSADTVDEFIAKNFESLTTEEKAIIKEKFWNNPNIERLYALNGEKTNLFSSKAVVEEEKNILELATRLHGEDHKVRKGFKELNLEHLTKEQREAFSVITKSGNFCCLEGHAGTGKSFLLKSLKNHYESANYKVRAFGPDNATAKVLSNLGFKDATSLHYFLYSNYYSKKNEIDLFKKNEVWIVDEASKIGGPVLSELLKLACKCNAKVILSGNSSQITTIERGGGLFKLLSDKFDTTYLRDIQRQEKEVHRTISKHLAFGDVGKGIDLISSTGGFTWVNKKEELFNAIVDRWVKDHVDLPNQNSLILASSNENVRILNHLIHSARQNLGEVSKEEIEVKTSKGIIKVSQGDFIEFSYENKKLGVKKGQTGVIKSISDKQILVQGDEGQTIKFNPQHYGEIKLGYATTFYKCQGKTVDNCYIMYSPVMDRNTFYVAETRHIKNACCFVAKEHALCVADLKQRLSTFKSPNTTLGYISNTDYQLMLASEERNNKIESLLSSEKLLDKAFGAGLKSWETIKGSFSSYIKNHKSLKSNSDFYKGSKLDSLPTICNKPLPEQALKSKTLIKPVTKEPQKSYPHAVKTGSSFNNLRAEDKAHITKYFEASERASALQTIVESEAEAYGIKLDQAKSFTTWQEQCQKRNCAAFEVLRNCKGLTGIFGKKGIEILKDRAERFEKVNEPIEPIENKLKDNLENFLYSLFPEGPLRRDGKGFRFNSKGSLSVDCIGEKKGCFYNFETKEGGGPLQLIQVRLQLTKAEALNWARQFLGTEQKLAPTHFSTKGFKQVSDSWISIIPPKDLPAPKLEDLSKHLSENYKEVKRFAYYNKQKELLCHVLRLESTKDDKKIYLPVSYGKFTEDSTPRWSLKKYNNQDGLIYNLPELIQNKNKPVLIVEGEKTADKAQEILKDRYVVITWQGGASQGKNVDWKILHGREIIIWPDNDQAGFKVADELVHELRHVGVKSLKVVDKERLEQLPKKWDLADQLPSNLSKDFIESSILRSNHQAIDIAKIKIHAQTKGLDWQKFNQSVAETTNKLKPTFTNQSQALNEIENKIFAEASQTSGKASFEQPVKTNTVQKSTKIERGLEL